MYYGDAFINTATCISLCRGYVGAWSQETFSLYLRTAPDTEVWDKEVCQWVQWGRAEDYDAKWAGYSNGVQDKIQDYQGKEAT